MRNSPSRGERTRVKAKLLFLIFPLAAILAQAEMAPTRLTCEYRENPLGIDVAQPQLSWVLESEKRGQRQTARHLLVASTPELLARNEGDHWDSGKVESGQSAHVRYDGKPLSSRQQCWWKVRAWDKDGTASAWSAPAHWTMALLKPDDWSGQWIGARTEVAEIVDRLGYAVEGKTMDEVKWVQVDLGAAKSIDSVVLHPMRHNDPAAGSESSRGRN